VKKCFKYRIYAGTQTIQNAINWLNLCRNLYNAALEQRITAYKSHRRSVSKFEQMHQLVELKQTFPEYALVDAQVLEDVIKRLAFAYDSFFRRVKNGDKPGYPRFKGFNRYDSFTLRRTGWKLEGNRVLIRNVGIFKLKLSRPIEGDIKTVTLRRALSGKWFVTFSCDNVPLNPLPKTNKAVGVDVGCESFLTTSEGEKIGNPRFFKLAQASLAKRQQRLSGRIKGSNRRNKARILVAKAHEKIRNQRHDFHFKTANYLLKEYDTIYIEGMPSWNSWRSMNRSMRDVAWFGFFDILKGKAEEADREIIAVPAKDTTQLCSGCGARVPKDLSIRIHSCSHCGLTIDRDLNAALNILKVGQTFRASCTA
jgi:putative transposase